MIKIDLNEYYNNGGIERIIQFINDTVFDKEEIYDFIFPDDENFYFDNNDLFELIYYEFKYLKINYKESDGCLYFSSKNNDYIYLVKAKDEVKNVIIKENTKRIATNAFYQNNNLKNVLILSTNLYIANHAFYFDDKLEKVVFKNNNKISLAWASIAYCSNLKNIILSEAAYEFNSSFIDFCELNNFMIPTKAVLHFGCFKNSNIKKLYVPKKYKDLSKYGISLNTNIYYEDDGNKLLLRNEINQVVETQDDYAHNFHTSSGSFSSTTIHNDEVYANRKCDHSFVKKEDFLKNYN